MRAFVPATDDLVPARRLASAAGARSYEAWTESCSVLRAANGATDGSFVGERPGACRGERAIRWPGRPSCWTRALDEAGIVRDETYVTNAVKHFKFTRPGPGKRRIHQTPDQRDVVACRPWLAAELRTLDPDVIVALGATAGKSLIGNDFRGHQGARHRAAVAAAGNGGY